MVSVLDLITFQKEINKTSNSSSLELCHLCCVDIFYIHSHIVVRYYYYHSILKVDNYCDILVTMLNRIDRILILTSCDFIF